MLRVWQHARYLRVSVLGARKRCCWDAELSATCTQLNVAKHLDVLSDQSVPLPVQPQLRSLSLRPHTKAGSMEGCSGKGGRA